MSRIIVNNNNTFRHGPKSINQPVISTIKLTDFSKSQAVKYTVNVIASWKYYTTETLLLQITNRKTCMADRIMQFAMTLE